MSGVVSQWRVHRHGGPTPARDEPLRRLESLGAWHTWRLCVARSRAYQSEPL